MKNFLDNFIENGPASQRKMVQSILKEATGQKEDIDKLANSVRESGRNRDLNLTRETNYSRISGPKLSTNFRSVEQNISSMFENSNAITRLLASIEEVLDSELRSLDKDIDAVEKSIRNYAFLLSDGLAFDYAFLEPFSNTTNFNTAQMSIPDRDHSVFGAGEYAGINFSDGSLVITNGEVKNYPAQTSVVAQNFSNPSGNSGYSSQETGESWYVKLNSPVPLVSPLDLFTNLFNEEYAGALVAVDYSLAQPSPCDSITIDPIASSDFQIIQCVVYYADEDSTTKHLLSEPVSLDNPKTFYFPIKPVSKIRCFYRKSSYTRKYEDTAQAKYNLNQIFQKNDNGSDLTSQKILNLTAELNAINMGVSKADSKPKFSFDRHDDGTIRPGTSETMRSEDFGFGGKEVSHLMLEALARKVNTEDDKIIGIDKNGVGISGESTYTPEAIGAQVYAKPNNKPILKTTSYNYEYSFGLNSVRIGISSKKDVGVYVSEKLPSPGDIGEIRLSSSEIHSYDTKLDNTLLTSVEYSVSNVSKPERESDWVPILPAGTSSVLSERMLFDEFGRAIFRFKASYNDNIVIYKNGYIIDITPFGKLLLDSTSNIIGVQIDPQFYTSRDIFTCYYSPIGDPTTVNFESSGFVTPPLAAIYDDDGPGEGFVASERLSISLSKFPFIDYAQASSVSYSTIFGMVGYSPISIRFEDGTSAINLTNYASPINQAPLDPDSDSITFIHTKNVIMFNRAVNSKMRVYYQYLPANVRVRVVLRSNSQKFVTPKVDYYQIKSKTRSPNSSSSL